MISRNHDEVSIPGDGFMIGRQYLFASGGGSGFVIVSIQSFITELGMDLIIGESIGANKQGVEGDARVNDYVEQFVK